MVDTLPGVVENADGSYWTILPPLPPNLWFMHTMYYNDRVNAHYILSTSFAPFSAEAGALREETTALGNWLTGNESTRRKS